MEWIKNVLGQHKIEVVNDNLPRPLESVNRKAILGQVNRWKSKGEKKSVKLTRTLLDRHVERRIKSELSRLL